MMKRFIALACTLAFALLAPLALANQSNTWSPTTGTVSGLQLTTNYNNAFSAVQSCNSGNTAPANDQSAGPVKGQCWLNTSSNPNAVEYYDGTSWVVVGWIDTTNHFWIPAVGGGTATVASATTTDLCSTTQSSLTISGTTTITSFGSSCQTGQMKVLTFSGALQLTHSSSLFLPNNANNVTTVANDKALAVYQGGGNWIVSSYVKADGTALNASSTFTAAVSFDSPISITLGSSTNNWNPSGLATANVIRITCSAAGVNITGLTAPGTDGKYLVVDNVGATNPCTFTANDANSSAANRFSFDRAMVVLPGRSITIKYDLTGSIWRLADTVAPYPVAGGFKNLKITNGGTPNNQLIITADELTVEDVNGGAVRLSTVSCTADITTSGAGGLDTGSVAQNTAYFLWVIYNPSTNTTSCMFSLASTFGSITLPSGYLDAARVGWDFVENAVGKRLNRILCFGRRCQYVVTASSATPNLPIPISGTSGNVATPTWTAVSLTGLVPTTASQVFVAVTMASVSSVAQAAPNNSYGAFGSLTNPPPCVSSSSSNNGSTSPCPLVIESGSIYYNSSGSSSALAIAGWEDNL